MSDQEKNYTLVFPGQGSQRLGMGMDFSEIFVEAKETFEEASRSLPFNVAELINSEDGRLNETKFTQPCILTVEIALLRVLQKYTSLNAVYYGGHSLGEYTALVAANVIPFELAVSLVYQRGLFMQSSSPVGFGAMAAVILSDLPLADIENMASSYSVDVANDNSTSQIVLSGKADAVKKLCSELEQKYTGTELRIVPLNVSAPFHSRHMVEIEAIFRDTLNVYKKEMNPTN
ncbi:ACP S-malonyltransferase, partial [bacterium]|nr:ACP S-malonyltransferase [bacterium]MBU1918680.1 ACP S-malonyltransferase [bacterium]